MTGRELINYILDKRLEDEKMFENVGDIKVCGLVHIDKAIDILKMPKFSVLKLASEKDVPVFDIYGEKFIEDNRLW